MPVRWAAMDQSEKNITRKELHGVPAACILISLGEELPLNGSLMIACAAAAAVGWTGGRIIAGFPSLHTFRPNPQRPTECVICGRRADAHRPN